MVELALTYTDAVQLDMDMATPTRSKLWALGIEQRRTGDTDQQTGARER